MLPGPLIRGPLRARRSIGGRGRRGGIPSSRGSLMGANRRFECLQWNSNRSIADFRNRVRRIVVLGYPCGYPIVSTPTKGPQLTLALLESISVNFAFTFATTAQDPNQGHPAWEHTVDLILIYTELCSPHRATDRLDVLIIASRLIIWPLDPPIRRDLLAHHGGHGIASHRRLSSSWDRQSVS